MTAATMDGRIAHSVTRRPPAILRPYVDSYVGYHFAGFLPGEHVGLPSRHLTFVISFDDRLELTRLPDGSRRTVSFDALLGGLHTSPAVIRHHGDQHGIQLEVTPAGARGLFGLPAGALSSSVVELQTVWGRLADELLDRLAGAATWPDRFAVLDRVLLRALSVRVDLPSGAQPETAEAWRRLTSTQGRVGVAALADHVGWTRRHLTDRFSAEYGVGPKALARVLRFERARSMLVQPDRWSLARVAAECGYADQAHLTRDWRALAGAPPTVWLEAERLPFVQDTDVLDGSP